MKEVDVKVEMRQALLLVPYFPVLSIHKRKGYGKTMKLEEYEKNFKTIKELEIKFNETRLKIEKSKEWKEFCNIAEKAYKLAERCKKHGHL